MSDRVHVTSADFSRNIGHWQTQALEQPVAITHHGRERLVLVSATRFSELQERPANRRVQSDSPQLHWLLGTMSDGYLVQTLDLKVTELNAVAAAILGVTAHEAIGRKLADMLPAAGAALLTERTRMVMRTGQAETFDGEGAAFAELYLTFRITRLGDAIVTLISNLTERKLVEEQRKVGDAVRLALVEIPGMAGVTLSQFGRMTFVSKCFSKYSGFSAEELQDVRLTDIMTQHYKRSFTDCFERAIGEDKTEALDVCFLLKNGELAEGHVSIAPYLLVDGGRGAVVLVAFAGRS